MRAHRVCVRMCVVDVQKCFNGKKYRGCVLEHDEWGHVKYGAAGAHTRTHARTRTRTRTRTALVAAIIETAYTLTMVIGQTVPTVRGLGPQANLEQRGLHWRWRYESTAENQTWRQAVKVTSVEVTTSRNTGTTHAKPQLR